MTELNRLACALCACVLVACGGGSEESHDQPAESGVKSSHGHVHTAPRGGLLVVLGEETAHVELLFDARRNQLSLHLLGPHAHRALRSAQDRIWIELEGGSEPLKLALEAQGNTLTGEEPGSTSHFAVRDDRLAGLIPLRGSLGTIEVLGTEFSGARFEADR